MKLKSLTLIALALSLLACSCSKKASENPDNRRPKMAVAVLVDLSATWHNNASDGLNKRVLSQVGSAIVASAKRLPLPMSVRYHAIGEASLGQEPICATNYRPSTFGVGKPDPSTITNPDKFARFVGLECPGMLLAKPQAQATQIAAAIISASRAMELGMADAPKVYVIASDFKEESATTYNFRDMEFPNSHFILLYRTLDEDRLDPSEQSRKLRNWKNRLTHLGAEVTLVDENAALASPKDFEALIRTASK